MPTSTSTSWFPHVAGAAKQNRSPTPLDRIEHVRMPDTEWGEHLLTMALNTVCDASCTLEVNGAKVTMFGPGGDLGGGGGPITFPTTDPNPPTHERWSAHHDGTGIVPIPSTLAIWRRLAEIAAGDWTKARPDPAECWVGMEGAVSSDPPSERIEWSRSAIEKVRRIQRASFPISPDALRWIETCRFPFGHLKLGIFFTQSPGFRELGCRYPQLAVMLAQRCREPAEAERIIGCGLSEVLNALNLAEIKDVAHLSRRLAIDWWFCGFRFYAELVRGALRDSEHRSLFLQLGNKVGHETLIFLENEENGCLPSLHLLRSIQKPLPILVERPSVASARNRDALAWHRPWLRYAECRKMLLELGRSDGELSRIRSVYRLLSLHDSLSEEQCRRNDLRMQEARRNVPARLNAWHAPFPDGPGVLAITTFLALVEAACEFENCATCYASRLRNDTYAIYKVEIDGMKGMLGLCRDRAGQDEPWKVEQLRCPRNGSAEPALVEFVKAWTEGHGIQWPTGGKL